MLLGKQKNIISLGLVMIATILSLLFASSLFSGTVKASESDSVTFDISKKVKQEKVIELENGEKAVIGMEPVENEEFQTMADISPGTTTWRTYYNTTFGTHAEYYTDIYLSSTTDEATIQNTFVSDYGVMSGTVSSVSATIDRKYQNGSIPAQSSFTMRADPPVGGTKSYHLYTKVTGATVDTSQQGFW